MRIGGAGKGTDGYPSCRVLQRGFQWLFFHQDSTVELATPSSQLDGAAKGKWVWWQTTLSFPLSWRLGAGPAALGAARSALARLGGESFFGDTRHDSNCCVTLQAYKPITSGNGINLSQARDSIQTVWKGAGTGKGTQKCDLPSLSFGSVL